MRKTKRISIGIEAETLKNIDKMAENFEDYVSRGEVIDLLVAWALENGFTEAIEGITSDDEANNSEDTIECPNCDSDREIPQDMTYCPDCGKELPESNGDEDNEAASE